MKDFRKQVRDHYDAQSLPPEKVAAVLTRGRGDVVEFPKRSWGRYLALVAAVALFAVAGVWWVKRDTGDVSYTAVAPRVMEFFANKEEIVPASQDKKELRDWLVSRGAPAEMEIPGSLLGLESAACQVVDVKGGKAYMSCYWREQKADRGLTELIHLLVARADDFRDQPKSSDPAVTERDGWSFGSWTKGDVIYTLAIPAPREKLMPFISSVETGKVRYISSLTIAR